MANLTPHEISRIALIRLTAAGLQPTPEHYARVYREVEGSAAAERQGRRQDKDWVVASERPKGIQESGRKSLRDGGLSSS